MKLSHSPRGGRLMTGLLAGLLTIQSAFATPSIPTGTLTVDRTNLRAGAHAQLGWHITFPGKPIKYSDASHTGTPTPTSHFKIEAYVLTTSARSHSVTCDPSGFSEHRVAFTTMLREMGSISRSNRFSPASIPVGNEPPVIAMLVTLK